jgi:hypothetical protein
MRTNKQIISLLRYGPRQEGFNDLKLILSEEERDSFYEYLEAQPEFKCDCPCLFESKREVIRFDCDTEADGGEVSFVLWDKPFADAQLDGAPTTVPKDGIEVTHHLDGSKTTTTCAIARRPVPFTGEIPPDWTGYNSCTDMDTGDFVEHFYPC